MRNLKKANWKIRVAISTPMNKTTKYQRTVRLQGVLTGIIFSADVDQKDWAITIS